MKFRTILIIALAALFVVSADARSRKRKVKAVVANTVPAVPGDTFSYAQGLLQGRMLMPYLQRQFHVDTAYVADVVRGMNAQLDEADRQRMIAYVAGLQLAAMNEKFIPTINQMATGREDTVYADVKEFTRGVSEALLGTPTALAPAEVDSILKRQERHIAENYRVQSEQFMQTNGHLNGVKTTESGLQYRILTEGNGAVATDTSSVEVHYEGKLIDGTVFDSSYKRNKPATFRPTDVIKGWTEALKMMPEGSVWEIYVPWQLAYGERGAQGRIPPYSALIFKIELLKVK